MKQRDKKTKQKQPALQGRPKKNLPVKDVKLEERLQMNSDKYAERGDG